jgi:dimethylpropiothetin dethiomethylase
MLKEFLLDAADALNQTRHPLARNVASLLATVDVDDDWRVSRQGPALGALSIALAAPDCHRAARALGGIADKLAWVEKSRARPPSYVGNHCSVGIIGPQGMIIDQRFKFGVYLQTPGTFYPAHRHEAEELYFLLSGSALWQRDDADFEPVTSGALIHHASYQPHAMWTHDEPLLALWAWTGNLASDTYSFVTD